MVCRNEQGEVAFYRLVVRVGGVTGGDGEVAVSSREGARGLWRSLQVIMVRLWDQTVH